MRVELDRTQVAPLGGLLLIAAVVNPTGCGVDRSPDPAEPAAVAIEPLDVLSDEVIVAADGAVSDEFGASLDLDGDRLAIGAPRADDDAGGTGAVYVFVRAESGGWNLEAKLVADESQPGDRLGQSVALDGDRLVAGAPYADIAGADAGAAFVFVRGAGGEWTEEGVLVDDAAEAGAQLGSAVDLDGDRVVAGAPLGAAGGAAQVFWRDAGDWALEAALESPEGAADDAFGFAVALSGDRAVVGANTATIDGVASGAVFVFARGTDGWGEEAVLTASERRAFDDFGFAVALDGDVAIVGAPGSDNNGLTSGAANVFESGDGGWAEIARLQLEAPAMHDRFGNAVALRGDVVVVGAWGRDDLGEDAGAAYVFGRGVGDAWSQELAYLAPGGVAGDATGSAVDTDGDLVAIGSYHADGLEADGGAVHLLQLGQGEGELCIDGFPCLAGFCVDGVCCDTECGGGDTTDCQACSVAAGAEVDGVCGPANAETICREAAGPCDAPETCDGESLACPDDDPSALDGQPCDDVSGGVCGDGQCVAGTGGDDGCSCRAGSGQPGASWARLLRGLGVGAPRVR